MVEMKPSAVSRQLSALLLLFAGPLAGQTSLSIYSDGRVVVRRTLPQALEKGRNTVTLRLEDLDPATLFSPDSSVALVSAVFTATGFASGANPPRIDFLAYGRYVDSVAPLLVALAVATLLGGLPRRGVRKILLVSGVSTLAVGLTLLGVDGSLKLQRSVNPIRLPAIFALVSDVHGRINTSSALVLFQAVTLGATALMIALALLASRQPKVAVMAVLALFVVVGGFDLAAIGPTEKTTSQGVAFEQKLSSLPAKVVAFDLDGLKQVGYYGLPFWMNKPEFVGFHSTDAKLPDAQVFVAPPGWSPPAARGLHLFGFDPLSRRNIWVK